MSLLSRVLTFRTELGLLWRAFMTPQTPMHLKVLMLLVPLYLLSPLDLIPDVIPVLGWLDDVVIVPMLVSWIVSMLPRLAEVRRPQPVSRDDLAAGPVIDGDYRRL